MNMQLETENYEWVFISARSHESLPGAWPNPDAINYARWQVQQGTHTMAQRRCERHTELLLKRLRKPVRASTIWHEAAHEAV